ncbi:MAG: DUF368 domain-containing protein [Brevinema sp.]
MKETISLVLKGMFIGIANIIPGVSGGTVAFITGIYKELNEAVGFFLIRKEKRWSYIFFLGRLFIGAVLGFLLFARAIAYLLGVKSLAAGGPLPLSFVPTYALFFGLIIGSLPVLFKMQSDRKFSPIRGVFFVLGALLLLGLANLPQRNSIDVLANYPSYKIGPFTWQVLSYYRTITLILIGLMAAFTMVVPGISGSALLVALGEYGPIINYVNERSISHLAFLGIGVMIGIICATILMTKLLEKWPGHTFYAILGLITASIIEIMSIMLGAGAPASMWILGVGTFAVGVGIALQSEKLAPPSKQEK